MSHVISRKSILSIQSQLNDGFITPDEIYCNLENLKSNVARHTEPIQFVEPLIKKPSSLSLLNRDENDDKINSKVVFDALGSLNPSLASDVRIWFTLGIELFDDYTSVRWPFPTSLNANKKGFVMDRLLSASGRSLRRNNAIGRLWRFGWVAKRCVRLDYEEALEALLLSQDVATSFVDRVTLTQVQPLADALLYKLFREHVATKSTPYVRDRHRDFLRQIDLFAGSRSIAIMSQDEMDVLMDEYFADAYSI